MELLELRLVPAVFIDTMGNLVVTGTAGNDSITVNHSNLASVTAQVNGQGQGTFDMTASGVRVIVYGLSGIDIIQMPGFLPTEVHGGEGNDYIYGGDRYDVLYGEGGNDYLSGSPQGADVLVGGLGRDTLSSGGGDDVLVGGGTTLDYASIILIRDDWVANHDPFSGMVSALVSSITDPNDWMNVDNMTGGDGQDLYIGREVGTGKDLFASFVVGVDGKRVL